MLEETAHRVKEELASRNPGRSCWRFKVVDEFEDRGSGSREYEYHYTVRVYGGVTFEDMADSIPTFTSTSIPNWLLEYIVEHDDLQVALHSGDPRGSGHMSGKFFLLIDNGETGSVEKPDDVKAYEELYGKVGSHYPDLSRAAMKQLAAAYDSMKEVILADEDELREVDGIGEKRSEMILNRHSDAVREELRNRESAKELVLVSDQDNVLRLPKEFECEELTPESPSV